MGGFSLPSERIQPHRSRTPSANRGAATPRAPRTPSGASTRSSRPSPDGPLRQRLAALANRLDEGVDESWRIAKRGHEIVGALEQIDTAGAAAEVDELEAAGNLVTGPQAATIESLRAQLAAAERLSSLARQSRDRLRLLDARFDELIARAVEVSVGTGDSEVLGHDVDQLVSELESLRVAMEETDKLSGLQAQTWPPSEGT